ncbi:MAG: hypothetical protein LBL01_07420, partial [Bifidobacteriaceae bacterium]|nr:hypothetical protein [Bifidobacteriaceae bacterium]
GLYAAGTWAAAAIASGGLDRSTRRLLPLVFATMHLAWGAGFLRGLPEKTANREPTRRYPVLGAKRAAARRR